MNNIILMGPPGAGKGTQSKVLAQHLNLFHLSTGDLLRKELSIDSARSVRLRDIINKGEYLTDEDIYPLVTDNVKNQIHESAQGIIFDGFPRTLTQAKFLDTMLAKLHKPLKRVIHISVAGDILEKRVMGRLACKGCGENYNVYYKPPIAEGVCDRCGGNSLERRKDDESQSFIKRLDVYEQETKPVLQYYGNIGMLTTVDGAVSAPQLSKQLIELLSVFI